MAVKVHTEKNNFFAQTDGTLTGGAATWGNSGGGGKGRQTARLLSGTPLYYYRGRKGKKIGNELLKCLAA